MGIIKSIPCGHLILEAYRNQGGEVLVKLSEMLPGGEEGRNIIWSHFSEDELLKAEAYVIKPALIREHYYTVSDADGTRVVFSTRGQDKRLNTIEVKFRRKRDSLRGKLSVTLNQEKLARFLRHIMKALRHAPPASVSY